MSIGHRVRPQQLCQRSCWHCWAGSFPGGRRSLRLGQAGALGMCLLCGAAKAWWCRTWAPSTSLKTAGAASEPVWAQPSHLYVYTSSDPAAILGSSASGHYSREIQSNPRVAIFAGFDLSTLFLSLYLSEETLIKNEFFFAVMFVVTGP